MTTTLHHPSESLRASAQRRGLLTAAARKYRSLFAIDLRQARFTARGFAAGSEPLRDRLERIGETFLFGFNHALIKDEVVALQCAIDSIEPDQRGFAVEGAAMGMAIADALMLGGCRLDAWLRRNESAYTYLAHVGAGWALGRAPWRRTAILRSCDAIHGWLIFDGLGFHDTYFMSAKVLRGWRRRTRSYAARVYDQGAGRALWFVVGGEIDCAIAAIARFDRARQPDLWSGLGLAVAYAGGASARALARALAAAGASRASLAQGAAFAAEAHARANHIPAYTREAVYLLTGRDAVEVAELVRALRARLPAAVDGDEPAYEQWRRHVQRVLVPS